MLCYVGKNSAHTLCFSPKQLDLCADFFFMMTFSPIYFYYGCNPKPAGATESSFLTSVASL